MVYEELEYAIISDQKLKPSFLERYYHGNPP